MSNHKNLSININLDSIAGRVQRQLRETMTLVAIGLNAAERITTSDFLLPDLTAQQFYDNDRISTVEEASASWRTWVLRNGFRDIAEIVHSLLEEIQRVLACWLLQKLQEKRDLLVEDFEEIIKNRDLQFHRRGFPDKIEFIKKEYGLTLDEQLLTQATTINAARNCLVHRSGVVSELDVRAGNEFTMEWSAVALIITENGNRREVEPPFVAQKEESVGISLRRPRKKSIAIGSPILVSTKEFSEICWTIFLLANTSATILETYGKALGIQFNKDLP